MRYHKLFHLHGIRFESRKDPSVNRQRLVERISKDSIFDLERYEYKGEPALMVIDPKTGLDVGVVPAGIVEKLLPYLDSPFFVRVDDLYDFDDGGCGARLQFCVLSDKEWQEMQEEAERLEQAKKKPKEPTQKEPRPIYMQWWLYVAIFFVVVTVIMMITGEFWERMGV